MFSQRLPASILVFIIGCLIFCQKATAQCSGTTWNATGTIANDNSGLFGNYTFSSTLSASASDDIYAVASATAVLLVGKSHYLKATNFNMNIPAGATICGVQAAIERSATGINVLSWVNDDQVRLVKNGTIVGTNHAAAGVWTLTDQTSLYGSNSDLWGTTLTASDVNSSGFGVAISAELNGILSLLPSARIDAIQIRVYYQALLPVTLVNFDVTSDKENPTASWTLESDGGLDSVFLQRSEDGKVWDNIKAYSAVRSGNYRFADIDFGGDVAYYRLRIVSTGNHERFSATKLFKREVHAGSTRVYPNPFTSVINISSTEDINDIHLWNSQGIAVSVDIHRKGAYMQLNTSMLRTGIYLLSVNGRMSKIVKQ